MILRAALDIYNGKLIGLAGIPDHKETREQMLRDEMKDLLRENIDSCIKEFQEGTNKTSTTTLRVALEFCIRVNAIDHLFGELFLMFAEAGMEQRFFENLEPFILSGKFKQTKIPKKILSRLIEYYR
jgi:vacuolar protein sorting-associated protein 8